MTPAPPVCVPSALASKSRKRTKLATDIVHFGVVQHFLAQAGPPSQIEGTQTYVAR